ncbi:MAG TPA: lysylphosphatidylglycerol synthase transmembrane domain-containing protein [Candidatus Saccharibacteria bacterium]|nr:lysylphosphatidylglycerol synthase transmembrane domain-containing protein [Candidatus Saccharibacteria bacterium]
MNALKAIRSWFRAHKRPISITIGLLFLALIVYYVIKNIQDFQTLRITNPWLLVIIFVFVLVRNFSTGLVMDTVLRPVGVRLRLVESFGLANLTRLVNQLVPGNVGIVMRSVYLKRRHGLTYSTFASAFTASQVVLYLISSLLGILALYVMQQSGQVVHPMFLYALVIFVLGLGGVLLLPRSLQRFVTHKRLTKVLSSWFSIRDNKATLARLSVWSLLFILSSTLIMYANFGALGWPITIWAALFFSSINIVNTLFAITPAGFGISEGIIVLLASSVGIPVHVGLAAALMQRVITFFAVIIVAPYFSRILFGLSARDVLRGKFAK